MSINFTPGNLSQIRDFANALVTYGPRDPEGKHYPISVTMRDGIGEAAVWISVLSDGEAFIRFESDEAEARKAEQEWIRKHVAPKTSVLPCDGEDA